MSQMPGKRLSASLIKAYWVQRFATAGPRKQLFLLFGNERMRWAEVGGRGGGARDWWALLLVCVHSQGQPPCQRNVRGHGGAHGRPRGPVSQLRPPAEQQRGKRYRKMHLDQSELSNDAWKESVKICVSQAPTTVRPFPEHLKKKKKKFEDVTTKSMTCVQMAKMYSYFKWYTPSGRYLTDILNSLGKIHIKNRGEKIAKRYI